MLPIMCKKIPEATPRDTVRGRMSAAVTLRHFLLAAVAWAGLLAAGTAHATISCSVSGNGFTSVYDPVSTVSNDNVSSVTINCSRASTDLATTTYSLAVTNGLYGQGQNNHARYLANDLKYDVYKDAAYSTRWGTNGSSPFTGPLNFGSGTSASLTLPYYNRVTALQNAVVGDYTDVMTATLTYSVTTGVNAIATPATLPVIITTNPQCQFSTPPGTMSFSYTSFQSTAATGSTQFATRCTSGLPYTMSLGATSGTLLGLAYSLSLSAASGTGTGAAQTYLVNGNIAANQAGICATSACSASAPQTITISY